MKVTLKIKKVDCANCAAKIEDKIKKIKILRHTSPKIGIYHIHHQQIVKRTSGCLSDRGAENYVRELRARNLPLWGRWILRSKRRMRWLKTDKSQGIIGEQCLEFYQKLQPHPPLPRSPFPKGEGCKPYP